MIGRVARSIVLAATLSIVVAGCVTTTPSERETTMDHVEAKAELATLLEAAQNAIGGEWEGSDTGARACGLPGGDEGAAYGLNRRGAGVEQAQQQAVIDAIVAAWADNDVDAVVTTKPEVNDVVVTQLRYPASGVEADGFYAEVWISWRASSVSGQTRCASGDSAEINAS